MTSVDLVFPVLGTSVPTDHNYALYAALSRRLPWFHQTESSVALAPLTGQYVGRGRLRLEPGDSHLRLRIAASDVPQVLPLAGQSIDVAGSRLRLGAPHVEALQPSPALLSHLVTIKHALEPDTLLRAARQQLDTLDIGGRLDLPLGQWGRWHGQPIRQVMRVKGAVVVGYALRVLDLKEDESLRLQTVGLGGKRRMGGGFFVPMREDGR